MAGKSKDDLFFIRRSRRIVKTRNLFIVTGDGSSGIKGQVSDIAQDLAEKRRFNRVYVCGSEVMMRNLFELFARSGVKFEASLEREMKCAVGLCGSCSIGPYLLCRDGPVLPRETLSDVLDEFGALRRDASGKYVRELGRPVA
jgi:dihydroorotate dehydrogenase electron transfer subunit